MATEYTEGMDDTGMDKDIQIKKIKSIPLGENPLFKKKYGSTAKSIKEVIFENDIKLVDNNNSVSIGGTVIELKMISAIIFEYAGQIKSENQEEVRRYQINNTCLRYKNNQYDRIELEIEAYEKLMFIWELYKKRQIHVKQHEKDVQAEANKAKNIRISENERLLKQNNFLRWIIILLFALVFAQTIRAEGFNYKYIYDVNIDKCVPIDYYKYKFTYDDLKNPKLVAEFPHRPGELTLVTPNGDMYVFTDTEERCKAYRKHFIEEMFRQNKMDEDRSGIDIDKE